MDISVNLTAPTTPGDYIGYWKLRNAAGLLFTQFYVKIKVQTVTPPSATPVIVAMPDLIINLLQLNPATPTQGATVNVTVQVYNQGDAAAGAFVVAWWPGEGYPSPACSWNVDSLVAHGGLVLHCVYAGYPSFYSSIVTKAVADTGGSVAESNEGNNAATMTISVNP